MRDLVAATFANAPAPQAPARNRDAPDSQRQPSLPSSLDTYNSHRKIKRPKLGDRRVYRPVRRHTLSRIDEAPPTRPRSKSLQHSADFSSTRPILRSRSNISADTSRSVPVCNESHEIGNQVESNSPQYAEPKDSDTASSYDRPVSMSDLPIMVPIDPATGAYIPYPEYSYYHDDGCRLNRYKLKKRMRKLSSKHTNLYLAFMY